jgi:hypothetical protein
MTESVSLKVDLYDPLKRPSRPSFDGPLVEEKKWSTGRARHPVDECRRTVATATGGSPTYVTELDSGENIFWLEMKSDWNTLDIDETQFSTSLPHGVLY